MDIEILANERKIETVFIDKIPAVSYGNFQGSCCRQIHIWKDKYIIKFDSVILEHRSYSQQSTNEIRFIKRIEEQDKKHFFYPVHWGFHEGMGYVVQEYGKPAKNRPSNYMAYAERTLLPILNKYFIDDVEFYSERNWLYTDEGAKIYDYGMT